MIRVHTLLCCNYAPSFIDFRGNLRLRRGNELGLSKSPPFTFLAPPSPAPRVTVTIQSTFRFERDTCRNNGVTNQSNFMEIFRGTAVILKQQAVQYVRINYPNIGVPVTVIFTRVLKYRTDVWDLNLVERRRPSLVALKPPLKGVQLTTGCNWSDDSCR